MVRKTSVLSLLASVLVASGAQASSVPVGFVDRELVTGLTSPTTLTALPDGRVLVVQQNGIIRLVQDDKLQTANFWEVPDVDSSGERGCLGITPDPGFATNHYVYIYCTIIESNKESHNHLIRVTEANGRAQDGSAKVLLVLGTVTSTWHMGGALRFAPDGKLYVAVGNHEDNPEPVGSANSQKLTTPFGKILRINPADGSAPSDNPFYDMPGAYQPIWSYGYRNPFSFDIQPGTGRILVGDVGQVTWEEIDEAKKGANYGWPEAEGPSTDMRYELPLYAYNHSAGACSITGGAFYNPPTMQFPREYVDTFLFADFCDGTINVLDLTTNKPRSFVTKVGYPTNIFVSPDGSLYYLSRNQDTMTFEPGIGTLSKITYTASAAPRISRSPMAQTVFLGDPAVFEVQVDDAKKIQWQRDGVDIKNQTLTRYKILHTQKSDDGASFGVVASNDFGSTKSAVVRLTITENRAPKAEIAAPEKPLEYTPGATVAFTGSGTDTEDGALAPQSLTWQADFQHDSHTHPLQAPKSGASTFSFTVPDFEGDEANTWIRVLLSVKDSGGTQSATARDIFPARQLSALEPIEPAMNGLGPIEKDRSNGNEAANDGRALTISGLQFPKGLGMHAPADVRYGVSGCSGQFIADVGVDDEVGKDGSVVFQVFLDDVLSYESDTLHGGDLRSHVSLDVNGKSELRLVVSPTSDGNERDHGDWGGAHVTGCAAPAAVCGNGLLEDGEQCDDGNTQDGDCCGAQCQFEPQDAQCGHDVCVAAQSCDGQGHCKGSGESACHDQDDCHVAMCDSKSGECLQTAKPAGTPCGDDSADACNGADSCDDDGVCLKNVRDGCCLADEACDDGEACTSDRCDPDRHECSHERDDNAQCSETAAVDSDAGPSSNGAGTSGGSTSSSTDAASSGDASKSEDSGCSCSAVRARDTSYTSWRGTLALMISLLGVIRARRRFRSAANGGRRSRAAER